MICYQTLSFFLLTAQFVTKRQELSESYAYAIRETLIRKKTHTEKQTKHRNRFNTTFIIEMHQYNIFICSQTSTLFKKFLI